MVAYISIAVVFTESMTIKGLDFLCSKCAVTRKIADSTAESLAYSKVHNVYTSCNNPAAFAFGNALKKASKCSYRQVDNFLNRSETYTKFKQTRNRFPRLKVQSFQLNEIRSVDLADMQKLSRYNHGINFGYVAVDTLSRFVWALPLRKKTATECKNALQKIMGALCVRKNSSPEMMKPKLCRPNSKSQPKPERNWVDKGREFADEFLNSAETVISSFIRHIVKPNRRLLSETSDL